MISMITAIKEQYQRIPCSLQIFLKRAIIIFIIWQVLYQFILSPDRLLDKWLTDITAIITAQLVSIFISPATVTFSILSATISINGERSLSIADGCNALELYIIYLGFIIAMPSNIRRLLSFAILGVASIFTLNIFRCFSIAWLHIHHPQWVDFAHHYLFYLIVYGFIFYLWTLYCKNIFISGNAQGRQE